MATSSYILDMRTVSMKEAKDRLTALARRVEKGEVITVTRNGKPVLDLGQLFFSVIAANRINGGLY